jgi:hypothetical protein
VEGQVTPSANTVRVKAAHLMCGSKIWTVAAFLCSGYFARIAWGRLHGGRLSWSHQGLDIATHLIWVLFMAGLVGETRCWKERSFFAVVLVNFSLAFGMGIWTGAPEFIVRQTRVVSLSLWVLAALLSAVLVFSQGDRSTKSTATGRSN